VFRGHRAILCNTQTVGGAPGLALFFDHVLLKPMRPAVDEPRILKR
jgi:hypothetical protein